MFRRAFPWLYKYSDDLTQEGKTIIQGKKVILREKSLRDAQNDYRWRTDEQLARLDATRPITMSYDSFYRYSKEEMIYASPTTKRLAIDTLDGNRIGNCMYYDISNSRGEAELGIMIGDDAFWGNGYGTDAVTTLLRHIFTETDLDRIYLHTLAWNARARKAFTKSGFREIGEVHRNGQNFIQMEILRGQWKHHNSPPLTQDHTLAADTIQED